MLEPAVCIDTFFVDREFLDRVDATAQAGFTAFELWGWEPSDIAVMAERQRYHGLTVENTNVTPLLYLLEDPDMALAAQAGAIPAGWRNNRLGNVHGSRCTVTTWVGPGAALVRRDGERGGTRALPAAARVMVQSIRALMPIAAMRG